MHWYPFDAAERPTSGVPQMKHLLLLVTLVLALGACGKKQNLNSPRGTTKPAKPKVEGNARATFIKNIPMKASLKAALEADITGGICAQEVMHKTGEYAGQRMVEISQGPCPAGLVDDTKVAVTPFIVSQVMTGVEYDVIDIPYQERAMGVEFDANGISILNSLCSGESDLCYIDIRNKKYDHIEMY